MVVAKEFWATSAQIMPVIALALIVEARAIISSWPPNGPRFHKGLLGLLWTGPLVVYAFATPACLKALRDEQVWSGWPSVITASIQVGIGSIVMTAALELLARSNPGLFARPIFIAMYRSIVYRHLSYKFRLRSLKRRYSKVELGFLEARIRLDELENAILDSGHPECESCRAAMSVIRAAKRTFGHKGEALVEFFEGLEQVKGDKEFEESLEKAYRKLVETIGNSSWTDPIPNQGASSESEKRSDSDGDVSKVT